MIVIRELSILIFIFALAGITEAMTEYVLGTPMDKIEKLRPFKWALMYVSMLVGIGLAFWYRLDLFYLLGLLIGEQIDLSPVGIALTGAMIGRGANWLNDFVSTYFVKNDR